MIARPSLWRVFFVGLTLSLAAPALAAPAGQEAAPKISIAPSFAGTPSTQIARSSETVSYAIAIANDDRADASLQLVVRPFRHDRGEPCGSNEAHCTLSWKLDGAPVVPDKAMPFKIAGLGNAELLLEGKARALGSYDSSFVVAPAAADSKMTPIRNSIRLIRDNVSLGTDPISFGPGGVRTKSPLGSIPDLHLLIANGSADVIAPPAIRTQLLKDDGSSNYAIDAGWQEAKCLSKTDPPSLAANERLDCLIALPSGLSPGRYRMDASLSGSGLALAEKSREFTVRQHWLYALVALLVGALGGGWFAGWQNSGRRRAIQLAHSLDLEEGYETLAGAVANDGKHDSRNIIDKANADLDSIADKLRDKGDADFAADLAELAARLPLLQRLAALEQIYIDAKKPAGAQAAYDAAVLAIAAKPLPIESGARLDALQAALAAHPPATARANNVSAASPGEFFFKLTGATAAAVRRLVRRVDRTILLVAILLVSAVGLVTLWQPNVTWGSLGDYLVALFTGFAATSAGTLGLLQLTNGYVLGRIGTAR
jgi:hypothetical protein